jgi:hypothetical protein
MADKKKGIHGLNSASSREEEEEEESGAAGGGGGGKGPKQVRGPCGQRRGTTTLHNLLPCLC